MKRVIEIDAKSRSGARNVGEYYDRDCMALYYIASLAAVK
jgi:hypothetical protein